MSKIPASKPKLSRDEAIKLVADFAVKEKVFLIGIRGYYKKTMGNPLLNDRGIYDDAIMLIAPDVFETYNANTDPSIDRVGIASLLPGLHYYKKGDHKINKPNAYPALRPATLGEKLPVTRDGKEGVFDGVAINIHRGSVTSTSSEGCQTIYPTQWISFQKNVYQLMDKYKQTSIPYILIEEK